MPDPDKELPTGRRWSVVRVSTLEAIRTIPRFLYDTFILLLAVDGRNVSDQVLRDLASRLLRAGARYVCVWGSDCERVHDAFDQAAIELRLNRDDAVIMTTRHERESLKEVTWFAAVTALPHEGYSDAGGALVAISVGSTEWETEISAYLRDGTPIEDEA